MSRNYWFVMMAAFSLGMTAGRPAMAQPTVLELFTSQGCSSCPPADVLAGRLAADPALIVLSFHVDYWDNLGWKDPFAAKASTERQYAYGKAMATDSVFTPQLIINGRDSLVGSQESAVRNGIAAAQKETLPIGAILSAQGDGDLSLSLSGDAPAAEVWEARFVRHAMTKIGGGENGGRSLESVNNVTGIRRIGTFKAGKITLPALQGRDDGLAIIVQEPARGKILGAAIFTKS